MAPYARPPPPARRLRAPPALNDASLAQLHQFTKFGKPGGYVYARGWVGPQVASLELRMQDSTVRAIPLHDRFFIYVVPQADWPLGKRPSYVIGRDAAGRVVYRRFLYPAGHCAYPVADRRCAHVIVHNG